MGHNGQTVPTYIYQLPIDVNEKLCRLLDTDDLWKNLASKMSYPSQTVTEIEQTARHQNTSPTRDLLTRWGQLNHKVVELFILLYRMRHVPGLQCLEMQVEDRKPLKALLAKQKKEKQRAKRPTRPEPTIAAVQPSCSTVKKIDTDFVRQCAPVLSMIPFEQLTEATYGWSPGTRLGEGGFGTVYKGRWNNLDVAIKRLKPENNLNEGLIREFWPNQYRHDNLVPIYGYSLRGEESCLVYPLMTGGSLSQRLYNTTPHPPLTWTLRHRIAHDTAKGLLFLHTVGKTPLIHGDIKPANILLDSQSHPKIADFGLATEGLFDSENKTHLIVTSRRLGTKGYSPDEFRSSGILSSALDVFSFGVVLMEMATRLSALQSGVPLRYHILKQTQGGDLAALEDPMVCRKNPDLCRAFITLGLRCTEERSKRPTMREVYRELEIMNVPGNPEF